MYSIHSVSLNNYWGWGGGCRCCSTVKLHLKPAVVCWMCDVTQPHKRQQLESPNQVDHPFMVGLALQSQPNPNCPQRLGQGLGPDNPV